MPFLSTETDRSFGNEVTQRLISWCFSDNINIEGTQGNLFFLSYMSSLNHIIPELQLSCCVATCIWVVFLNTISLQIWRKFINMFFEFPVQHSCDLYVCVFIYIKGTIWSYWFGAIDSQLWNSLKKIIYDKCYYQLRILSPFLL